MGARAGGGGGGEGGFVACPCQEEGSGRRSVALQACIRSRAISTVHCCVLEPMVPSCWRAAC